MTVNIPALPPEIADFVQGKITSGEYRSVGEVVCTALRLMEQCEQKTEAHESIDEAKEGLGDNGFGTSPEEQAALEWLARNTPNHATLQRLAKENPPPPEWFQGDEELTDFDRGDYIEIANEAAHKAFFDGLKREVLNSANKQ